MFGKWFRKGILLAFIPLTALGCHGRRHEHSAAEVKEHTRDMAGWALDAVDASEEQEASVEAILDQAVEDLLAFRGERKQLGADLRAILAAETVDEQELAALRTRALDLVDRASDRGFRALLEVSRELDPEQRRKLVQRWAKRHGG